MLTYLAEYNATLTTHEDMHPFVECSTWADDYKYHGHAWQGNFHFMNTPYYPEGESPDYDINEDYRNLTAVEYITQWLSAADDGDDYLDWYGYQYISTNLYPGLPDVQKSYALRLLIHYMGDLMQPLHNTNLYDDEYPSGDKGGNSFTLPYHYGADELHAVWDIIIYSQHNNIARPFTTETWDEFQPQVLEMMDRNADVVSEKSSYETLDFHAVHMESWEMAKDVYVGK